MENTLVEKRMYFLVPYNISPIQQAIQAGHCALEYASKYWESTEFQDFLKNWKTWIILNGGTTNNGQPGLEQDEWINQGTLQQHLRTLQEMNVPVAVFTEPDLNDALTAVCFVLDEKVFNKKKYPDFENWLPTETIMDLFPTEEELENSEEYKEWVEFVGGKTNVLLRAWLKQFRMA